jgi:hypothetical protein
MSLIEAVYLGTSVSRLYIIIVFETFCSNVLIELHIVCVVKVHIFFPVSTEQISVDSQLNVLLRRTCCPFNVRAMPRSARSAAYWFLDRWPSPSQLGTPC